MPGSVVTFYSYKGGVGRSFALANIATILTQWGSNVLVVDWDIEAPGLNHYFAQYAGPMRAGVLDFINDCALSQERDWADYVTPVDLPQSSGRLRIMPAAADGVDYTARVQRLDWEELFGKYGLGARLESLRASWVSEFDFILVDSRTGVTDFSGLTTAQLPDILAFMFTANNQSLQGCADITRRAMEARRNMPIDRPALLPLPIPARFEQREEYDRAQVWRGRFADELKPFLDTWAPPSTDYHKLIDLLCIPYVPRWTFGEDLAALVEAAGTTGTRSPSQAATFALETIAALLMNKFAKIDLLASSRDEYVHVARSIATSRRSTDRQQLRVFFSYSQADQSAREVVQQIIRASEGIVEAADPDEIGNSRRELSPDVIQARIATSDVFIAVVTPSLESSSGVRRETEWFLRQALRSNERKTVIPVVLPGGESAFSSSRLADYKAIFVNNIKDQNEISVISERLESVRSKITDVGT
ncbi:KGGVGR-motif variant AAA ATPase [Mesorhizobium sp. LjRoot246]|uniref:KGGVGR-motif variant AAA ATPase n=1 Tax=Mesorhizobium sp. LjRoot246 TaxID=3342294 RepID=UPI003ECE5F5D